MNKTWIFGAAIALVFTSCDVLMQAGQIAASQHGTY
jgi:hypothetical protein